MLYLYINCKCLLGIVCQGFTRVEMNEGEIKKEFDDMRMQFLQEQQEIELQNVELAKRLQVNSVDK